MSTHFISHEQVEAFQFGWGAACGEIADKLREKGLGKLADEMFDVCSKPNIKPFMEPCQNLVRTRDVAAQILRLTFAGGNGAYEAEFGPVNFGNLIDLATNGEKDYCQVNGHTRHMQLDRCIFCCKPMEAKK